MTLNIQDSSVDGDYTGSVFSVEGSDAVDGSGEFRLNNIVVDSITAPSFVSTSNVVVFPEGIAVTDSEITVS